MTTFGRNFKIYTRRFKRYKRSNFFRVYYRYLFIYLYTTLKFKCSYISSSRLVR